MISSPLNFLREFQLGSKSFILKLCRLVDGVDIQPLSLRLSRRIFSKRVFIYFILFYFSKLLQSSHSMNFNLVCIPQFPVLELPFQFRKPWTLKTSLMPNIDQRSIRNATKIKLIFAQIINFQVTYWTFKWKGIGS